MSNLQADRAQLEAFFGTLFRYADDGTYISLRTFDQLDRSKPPVIIEAVKINGHAGNLIEQVYTVAQRSADHAAPTVFAPPIATFKDHRGAKGTDLANGLVLSIELDDAPSAARSRMEGLLGPATLVIASGSEWTNPVTGQAEPKMHLHWRLSEPTRDDADHATLRAARTAAALLVGGDPTGKPIVHPYRWPGSWNTKATPRMCSIVAHNQAAEIHLAEAMDTLQAAVEAAGIASITVAASSDPHAAPSRISSAMTAIPNPGTEVHYDDWIKLGYAVCNAVGPGGFDIWDEWSRKSDKYDAGETVAAWRRIVAAISGTDAPVKIGAGTIFMHAEAAGWKDSTAPSQETARPASEDGAADEGRTTSDQPPLHADPEDATPPEFTDEALALRFSAEHADRLRYVAAWGRWLIWDGTAWRFDDTMKAFDYARLICRQASTECGTPRVAANIASAKTVAAVEKLAKADRRHAATTDQWDRDPWLLNTPGGVVDLRTGQTRVGRPDDYMTKITAVAPGGDCARWRQFLATVTDNDADLQAFLKRMAGYALTGTTHEHALFFVYGTGGNGKGVFLNTLTAILGGYASVASIEAFTASSADRHPTDLAMLRGSRLVSAQETEEGRPWAESRIKALTGGDPITARFMRQDFFTYQPAFKLIVAGNHKPGLRNADEAIRRRLHLIPFSVKIEKQDKALPETLKSEWAGILQWMIEGCAEWRRDGLNPPAAVVAATGQYLEAEDAVALWLDECCDVSIPYEDSAGALFTSWKAWADQAGEFAGSQKRFSQGLETRGFAPHRTGSRRTFIGLRLKPYRDPRFADE